MALVSKGTNFVPPSWNIDQLLQTEVRYIFDSYSSLITIFNLKKTIFTFKFIENIKKHYYSLKTIKFFKIKRVVLKHGVQIGIPWKKVQTWSIHHVLKRPKQKQLTHMNSMEKFLKSNVIWCNINSQFSLHITCYINTILNSYKHNLLVKLIFISRMLQ